MKNFLISVFRCQTANSKLLAAFSIFLLSVGIFVGCNREKVESLFTPKTVASDQPSWFNNKGQPVNPSTCTAKDYPIYSTWKKTEEQQQREKALLANPALLEEVSERDLGSGSCVSPPPCVITKDKATGWITYPCCCMEFVGFLPLPFPPYYPGTTYKEWTFSTPIGSQKGYMIRLTWIDQQSGSEFMLWDNFFVDSGPDDCALYWSSFIWGSLMGDCPGTRKIILTHGYRNISSEKFTACSQTLCNTFFYKGSGIPCL